MRIEKFLCDICRGENDEQAEYRNEVILVGDKQAQRHWKVCFKCLELVTEYVLDNVGKNE